MTTTSFSSLVFTSLLGLCATKATFGADWPQFRGPNGSGISADAGPGAKLAVKWSVALPGQGLSAPIVVGDQVFVTTSEGPKEQRLHTLAFSTKDGALKWDRLIMATGRTMCHEKTAVAAPTPCSDGKAIYSVYSSNDVAAWSLEGKLLWLRGLMSDYPNAGNSLGMASSPVMAGQTLVVMSENDSDSFTAGLDPASGKNRWKMDRPKMANWTSPVMHEGVLCVHSGKGVTGISPDSGSVVWNFTGGHSTMSSSAVANGLIYAVSKGITVIKPTPGQEKPEELWNNAQLNPSTISPLVKDGRIYLVNGAGVLVAAKTEDGEAIWKSRLKGPFSGSPVMAGKYLYAFSEKGLGQVVDTTTAEGECVSTIDLKEMILCTPAISGTSIYVRSDSKLWCLGPES